jgi:hypothetical protein
MFEHQHLLLLDALQQRLQPRAVLAALRRLRRPLVI